MSAKEHYPKEVRALDGFDLTARDALDSAISAIEDRLGGLCSFKCCCNQSNCEGEGSCCQQQIPSDDNACNSKARVYYVHALQELEALRSLPTLS